MTPNDAIMRVAALYDIHGNLPALEAVLDDLRQADVERIVVGGDVVPGPMPRETLARLLDLDLPVQFIQGNGEREVLARMRGQETAAIPEQYQASMRWTAQALRQARYETVLASWPSSIRVQMPAFGGVLFCHATPRSDTEVFTRLTPEEHLLPIFTGLDAAVVVCGHTHMPFDRTIGGVRVVNPGSVGMPFGAPGAYWLVLGSDVEFRTTHYDLGSAAERVRDTGYPQAHEFAARNILQPPSEEETLDTFTRIAWR